MHCGKEAYSGQPASAVPVSVQEGTGLRRTLSRALMREKMTDW